LIDVTNRNRSESQPGWKRRFRFSAAPAESVESAKHSEASCSSTQSQTNGSSISELNNSSWYETEIPPPIIVHCNDGASESGVYLLVEAIIQSIEHNVEIDLPAMLKSLRQQRMHLVKNVQSYRFCYSLIENLLTRSRLI
jgi:protein tyrosine phosphatase